MTEYDYSPEAYERYLATQQRISNWVATTEGYRNEYGNALTVPPSQIGSHCPLTPRGQLLSPVNTPLRSSQSQDFHPQNPPHSQSFLASSRQRSAAELHSQYLQHSNHHTLPRSRTSLVSSQAQHPPTVSRHGSSTHLHATPQQRDTHTSRTSSTYVTASHPQKPPAPSQHVSIAPEAPGQQYQHASMSHASQRSLQPVVPPQKTSLRHHASTSHLEAASRQTSPTYMVTIPPSDKPTYVYPQSGWVPSAGLVIVPSKGQSTSIVISPPGSQTHISIPQVQTGGYTQPVTTTAVGPHYSHSTTPKTSPLVSSQATYPNPSTVFVPVPVVIIQRERHRKGSGGKKSKKKEKRSKSEVTG